MKNIATILRRDLSTYFTSPIGYIFMIVYVLIGVGLFITSFFTFPVADLRPYFNNLPILLCVFIPAVTMRVWAEERKENTWELLLTFPMKSSELVIGKFLATFIFYVLTVVSTFTLPIMLMSLGKPDVGSMVCGYFGTLMLGAFFLSIGIFFSGFFKDQIVAFVVTLLACFGVFLVGTDFIAGYMDGMVPGLGSLIAQLLGVTSHFSAFTRGVVEIADLLYFVAWTALFLLLNIMFIEGRGRPKAKLVFSIALAMCLGIGFLFNWLLTGASLGRWDVTQDKIYTVSDASKRILSKLSSPVQIKLYISQKDKMPTGLGQLEQNITDKLEELRLASGGKLEYKTMYFDAANVLADPNKLKMDKMKDAKGEKTEKTEEKAIEERMLDKGVEPFSVRSIGEDEVTSKVIYSSIGIGYKDKKEEIVPKILPQNIEELEYRIVSTVHKLTREKPPVVALFAPKDAIDPQLRNLYMQMGQQLPPPEDYYETLEQYLGMEKYDVKRVDLTEQSPMPAEYDTLVVVNPRQLNDRQKWEVNRALVSGKPVVMAVQTYEWDMRVTRDGTVVSKKEEKPEVNDLLKAYGLGVSDEVLMDTNKVPLTMQGGDSLAAMLGGGHTVDYPIQILINSTSMATDNSITSRLSSIFYLWGTAITLDAETLKKNGLEAKTLMSSTKDAWTIPGDAPLTATMFEKPDKPGQQYPLMAMVSGQFPDAYKDKPCPAWPKAQQMPGQPPEPPKADEAAATPVTPKPGKLILTGCSEVFRKNFLQEGNLDLFMNSVDAVTLGDDLVNVRSKKPIDRRIDMPTPAKRRLWKLINYTLATAILATIGIATSVMRRRARNAYTMGFGTTED